jgi:hypothetical protein
MVIDIIIYTFRGYSESQATQGKLIEDYNKEHERYISEIDDYITVKGSIGVVNKIG